MLYEGKDVDKTTMSVEKVLRLKLLGYISYDDGYYVVFYNPTSVILVKGKDFVQLRVVTQGVQCFLRIDTSIPDFGIMHNGSFIGTEDVFTDGHIISEGLDYIRLFTGELGDYEVTDIDGIEYRYRQYNYAGFVIGTYTSAEDYEYYKVLNNVNAGGSVRKNELFITPNINSFAYMNTTHIHSIPFSFMHDYTCMGMKAFETSMINRCGYIKSRLLKHKLTGKLDCIDLNSKFLILKTVLEDDDCIYVFNSRGTCIQCRIIHDDDDYTCVRVDVGCDHDNINLKTILYSYRLSNEDCILSTRTRRKQSLSIANMDNFNNEVSFDYNGHKYLLLGTGSMKKLSDVDIRIKVVEALETGYSVNYIDIAFGDKVSINVNPSSAWTAYNVEEKPL